METYAESSSQGGLQKIILTTQSDVETEELAENKQASQATGALLGKRLVRKTRNRKGVPTFLQKLFDICQAAVYQECIKWSDDGQSFEVVNREIFERETLPNYFKHSNLNSFVR